MSPSTTTTYEVTADSACGTAQDSVTVFVEQCQENDFDAGSAGWTTSGLWHLVTDSTCAEPGYTTPPNAMYYGQDGSCDYDTARRTSGDLISPPLSGISALSSLSFNYFRDFEDSLFARDRTEVAVAVAGSSQWQTVWARDSTDASRRRWTGVEPIALSPWAGQTIQVRFHFDSVDGAANGHAGWMIDSVTLSERPVNPNNMPPVVEIVYPRQAEPFEQCECIAFSANAFDREDGDLAWAVHWYAYPILAGETSDPIDLGPDGAFQSVLLPGTYTVSASVVDSDGYSGSDSVTVHVQDEGRACAESVWPPIEFRRHCGDD